MLKKAGMLRVPMHHEGWSLPDLSGKVAVVTGASRGVGLGIAHELGLAGATVYVTGRSSETSGRTEGRQETVEAAARLVTRAGGRGLAVPCDHTRDADVAALAGRVQQEQGGRLDILVNNAWGGYEAYDPAQFQSVFWEQPVDRWDRMMTAGLRAHYVTSRLLVPLMLPHRRGLVVLTSAGDGGALLGDVQYDVAKHSVQRLAEGMAWQLQPFNVACLALLPGFTRTERVVEAFAAEGAQPPPETHSPRFVGRAVAALAADPRAVERSGKAWTAGELGLAYGFPDVDGSQPGPWRLPPAWKEETTKHWAERAAKHPRA